MGLVGTPCLLTSLTTACGFASMSFVPIKSLAQGGIVDAIGLLPSSLVAALIADFFFMPALVLRFKPFGPEGEAVRGTQRPELAESA